MDHSLLSTSKISKSNAFSDLIHIFVLSSLSRIILDSYCGSFPSNIFVDSRELPVCGTICRYLDPPEGAGCEKHFSAREMGKF